MPENAPLTSEEIQQVQKLFGSPIQFPPEFKSWLTDWIATNIPQLPIAQALGGRGVPRYLDVTSVTSSVGSTTADTTVVTFKLPGKHLAQNGRLSVKVAFTAMCTDVTNSVTAYLNFNGTRIAASSTLNTSDHLDGNNRAGLIDFVVMNAGSYSAQYVGGVGGFDGQSGGAAIGAAGSGSVDTSSDVNVTVSVQFASAGSQLWKLVYASTELFNPIGV